MKIMPKIDENIVKELSYAEAMVASATKSAELSFEFNGEEYPSGPDTISPGGKFIIPLALPEGVASGDGREAKPGSITTRELPLPLMWQIMTEKGHDRSVVVGRIDSIERTPNGLGNARGVFDTGSFGREAERMVRGGFLRGVSADLDRFEATAEDEDENELADKNTIKNQKLTIDNARLMGITIVAKPAFEECFIIMDKEPTLELEEVPLADGVYEDTPEDFEFQLATIAASAAPVIPPKAWFKNPNLDKPTPLTVTDEGKVFGHIASWQTSHIGMGRGVKPPRSASQYAYFRTGELRTDDGDVQVGQITLVGGHASLQASAEEAVRHYDDTASAMADVVAGEDNFGIWVSGALRPDVTPSQIRAFRASPPSGDWRPINGRLELVAVCAVNVPGFPVVRTITASGGVPGALVAAGAAYLAELKEANKVEELDRRLRNLEGATTLSTDFESVKARMSNVLKSKDAELNSRLEAARSRMMGAKKNEDAELSAKIAELKARFNSR
ncbi:capsid maturation protease [Arthrobacter phage Atuin]|nr:capsid maturation protease [Arthrobacter phage Atuin]